MWFLLGGVESLVSLEELILTRNRLGTMALIQPLIIRKAREGDIWEKSRIRLGNSVGEIIYMNQTTGETLRRPPQGANIIAASGYESEEDERQSNSSKQHQEEET